MVELAPKLFEADQLLLQPPWASRSWKTTPLPGVEKTDACGEPGSSDWRIMTPAFAHGSVLEMPVTRATISPSPFKA